MTERGREFVRRLSLVFVQPPRIRECERPIGPARTLDDWRGDVVRSRRDINGKPGLYLDRSPTGSGKSTADIEAVRQIERALIVVPTHENAEEVEKDMQAASIDAMKYPARKTSGKYQNCQNTLADTAEQLGLSAVAAVCPTCDHRAECLRTGYLGELDAVKSASVAIATHSRAIFNRFDKLAEGRGEYIAVHEDSANTVCPDVVLSEMDLQRAADIVNRLLSDPAWLDWFGQAAGRDENGSWTPNENLAKRRSCLREFVGQLADVIDSLLDAVQNAGRTASVNMPSPVAKAIGIESLLLRATLESKADFAESPWRLLLAAMVGELFALGVIVDESRNSK